MLACNSVNHVDEAVPIDSFCSSLSDYVATSSANNIAFILLISSFAPRVHRANAFRVQMMDNH